MWFDRQQRNRRRVSAVLKSLRLAPRSLTDHEYAFIAKLDRHLNVFIKINEPFVQLIGDPDIGFMPRQFPNSFLALLLVRNSEVACGGWQLLAAGEHIWCNFSVTIPLNLFRKRVVKDYLEQIIAEAHHVATRYQHLNSI